MVVKNANEYDLILDVIEDRCPMPLLKTKMALSKMAKGEVLCVHAGDAGSLKDIPHYLSLVGHTLVKQEEQNDVYTFIVQKN